MFVLSFCSLILLRLIFNFYFIKSVPLDGWRFLIDLCLIAVPQIFLECLEIQGIETMFLGYTRGKKLICYLTFVYSLYHQQSPLCGRAVGMEQESLINQHPGTLNAEFCLRNGESVLLLLPAVINPDISEIFWHTQF